jgi:hypothetical protein
MLKVFMTTILLGLVGFGGSNAHAGPQIDEQQASVQPYGYYMCSYVTKVWVNSANSEFFVYGNSMKEAEDNFTVRLAQCESFGQNHDPKQIQFHCVQNWQCHQVTK